MKKSSNETVRQIFCNFLEQNNSRKTPERFAILDTAYSFSSCFSMQELNDLLVKRNFRVSRATIYNTIKLLLAARLLLCRKVQSEIKYEACCSFGKCYQVCTFCGKVKEVKIPDMATVIDNTHLKRFRKESFSLSIYGVCSTCQAMHTRLMKKENINNKINRKKNGKRQS